MAVGDVKSGMQVTSPNTGTFNIQPPSGEEWVIHNLFWGNPVQLKIINGANSVQFDSDTTAGGRYGLNIHVTNTQYLQIVNTHTTNSTIAYDGVQTK